MENVIELLRQKKEEYEGLKIHIEGLKNKGSYRTNEEREGADKLLVKCEKTITELNEAIDKLSL